MRKPTYTEKQAAWDEFVRDQVEQIELHLAVLQHRLVNAQAAHAKNPRRRDARVLLVEIELLREDILALAIHGNPADLLEVAEAVRRWSTVTLH